MANYKKQYLNLYDPIGANKFCVQQKADECYISRSDKQIKFYCPDLVVRKKEAIVGDEEDVSVFGKFDSLDSDISTGFAARDVSISAAQASLAALQNTVTSNKTASDNADAAEVNARTTAVGAVSATVTANKSLADAGFVSATSARTSLQAALEQKVQDEEDARVLAIQGVWASIALVLNSASTEAIDSIAELVAVFDGLSAEDTTIHGLVTSLTSRMTAAEGILAQLLNPQDP